MHRSGYTGTASPAVSDERSVFPDERTQAEAASGRVPSRSSNPIPGAGVYTPPSPPPPAPISGIANQPSSYDAGSEQTHARGGNAKQDAMQPPYTALSGGRPAAQAGVGSGAWSSVHSQMEPGPTYALQRIHAAAVSLCKFSGEHLDTQTMPRQEDLYGILPLVSEINQEIRTLFPVNEGRPGRDALDMAPYYPWMAGSRGGVAPYWVPGSREDRDGRLRSDEAHAEEASGPVKGARGAARMPRAQRSSDDLSGYGRPGSAMDVYAGAEQPGRVDPMFVHQTPYGSHGMAGVKHGAGEAPQQTYVPKYRKRSRAPAPGVCHSCGNSDTPEWRRGPDGARTLCNSCGLHFAKLVRRRTMEYANAPPGTPIPPVTIAELRASTNVPTPNAADTSMASTTTSRSVSGYSNTSPSSAARRADTSSEDLGMAPPPRAPVDAGEGEAAEPKVAEATDPALEQQLPKQPRGS